MNQLFRFGQRIGQTSLTPAEDIEAGIKQHGNDLAQIIYQIEERQLNSNTNQLDFSATFLRREKGLGKGGAKRHRKVLRDNIQGQTSLTPAEDIEAGIKQHGNDLAQIIYQIEERQLNSNTNQPLLILLRTTRTHLSKRRDWVVLFRTNICPRKNTWCTVKPTTLNLILFSD
ncbi:uncharacterized protein LOC135155094 isoform X2 [Lytechinus pictus]|uniref:uncharacterized protein LOC135155094 isoform X2 n=1 Tax=Lytechinus pictus TaxID=7653 RepID=UPI0030B9BB48